MKKIIIASGVLALMAAATSCDKYDIYPEQYGKVLMIKDAGDRSVTLYSTDDEAKEYISVMKGGFNAESSSEAYIGIMTDQQFGDYKDNFYGDRDFPGLQPLPTNLYHLTDALGNTIDGGVLNIHFDGDKRYSGVNVVMHSSEIDAWYKSQTYGPNEIVPEFVIPVGLYSETDSVNANGNAVMVQPALVDPVLSVSVANDNFQIDELSRTALLGNKLGTIVPEVTVSVPCQNKYGFKVLFTSQSDYVSDYNAAHKNQAPYSTMANSRDVTLFSLCGGETYDKSDATNPVYAIDFPAGVTSVTFPMEIFPGAIDANDISHTFARGFRLKKAVAGKDGYDLLWNEGTPDNVKKQVSLPTGGSKGYTFFVGYRVKEMPLELNEGLVTSPDCEPTEGSIGALFDNNLSSFFHSKWSVDPDDRSDFGSYLEIDCSGLGEMNACYFQITARNNANPAAPTVVRVYYSNETEENRENVSAWTQMHIGDKPGEVTISKLNTSAVGEIASVNKPFHTPDWENFDYVRFCVMKSPTGALTTASKSIYWNLAEFVMYGKWIEEADRQ